MRSSASLACPSDVGARAGLSSRGGACPSLLGACARSFSLGACARSFSLGACARSFSLGACACLFLLGACACLFLLGACASTAVVTRADELEQIVAAATQRGARACAPQELALAKVNLEFARLELSQGDQRRADHHLTLAEPNAKAALRVASDGKCRGAAVRPALAAGPDEGAP